MLKSFVEKKHVRFEEGFDNWEDAIRAGCVPLLEDGTIEPQYVQAIIDCVKEYGPYIIIAPQVAMPHSTVGADGVNRTEIAFMKVKNPVHFDPEDSEKDARLFFTLAAENPDRHIENMVKLSEMLTVEGLVEALLEAETEADLLQIHEKFLASSI